jgi:sterol desaturase/sphingolipid hydroxylase (fatty acid hydroxylase superfamily)
MTLFRVGCGMEKIIVFAFPVFLFLICLEFAYGWLRQRNSYRLNDALSSLSQGLISQLLALVTQLFQIGLYTLVFKALMSNALTIAPNEKFWDTWVGWVLAVVLFDFFDYWLHRAGHECALLWAAHVVHHQSQHLNFSTALRQESAVAFIGWIFYLPMALAGVPPEQFAAAGLIVLVYQFWIHTEHIGKLGWFDRVFSSPSNHRVHHAVNDQYINRNYGGMLVIWDRLFGTFAEEQAPCVYGTRKPLNSWDPGWAIVAEYASLAQASRQTRAWPDKLRVWFKQPGWRPADAVPEPSFDLEAAKHLHEVSGADPAPVFASLQFALMTMATAVCLWYAEELSYPQSLGLCAAIIAGLWALGAHLQGRMRVLPVLAIDFAGLAAAYLIFHH